jgi:ribonucleoside-diphosphate reductase alpha chain
MSSDTVMFVVKRDGHKEEVSFDKVLHRIQNLAKGLEHVNPTLVAQKVCTQIQNNIKTTQLDEFAAETATTMSARNHPNYALLAARILVSNHQKNTPSDIAEVAHLLDNAGLVSEHYYDCALLSSFELNKMVDYERDFLFDYFGFKTLMSGYLLKDKSGKVIERPQHMWMRVAIQLHGVPKTPFEKMKSDDFEKYDFTLTEESLIKIKETYDALSQGYFIHATPTLFNSGCRYPQLSSCFLLHMHDDSIHGIYKTLSDCAHISKWAGGIGLHVHNIRARGSLIQGTNGKSTGIVPMLKVFNDTAKYVNQGGKRPGSFAIYLEPWHADVEDFLRMKLNQGNEDERARDLFYALWIPDLFMKRVEENGTWTLMCPHECPGLSDVWGDKFEDLYCEYEAAGKGRKTMPAQKLWQMVLDAQIQTGTPYLLYKDAANAKSNQQNLGTIKSSNLCTEIMEYSSPTETAVCNLGSLSLPKFVNADNTYNFEALRKYTKILIRNLDIVIDKNFYPTPETQKSNSRHRPVGLGIQGLADVFARMRLSWTSEGAARLNREIFENIYYAAMESSVDRACQHYGAKSGAYSSFVGSPLSEGKFQCDLWNDPPKYATYLDWDGLRTKVKMFGARNSLLIAPMPTASTSQILGNNECFEPFTSNIYVRHVLAGDFIVINKYLVDDLMSRGLWTSDIRTDIIANNGSIQGLTSIPSDLRELYKTAWEIPQKTLINMARDRAPFICQSQSLNLFVAEPTYAKISSMHFYAWKQGLKTGCYYLRTKAVASAQKFTIEPKKEDCLMCSA